MGFTTSESQPGSYEGKIEYNRHDQYLMEVERLWFQLFQFTPFTKVTGP